MHKLVFAGSKYSFFLVVVLCLPIILEANQILHLWLGLVPEYAVVFLRLTLMISMLSVVSNTLVTSMMATGDIKIPDNSRWLGYGNISSGLHSL